MRKYINDHIRVYATEAFRFYAGSGGVKKYVSQRDKEMKLSRARDKKLTEAALKKEEIILRQRAAELADLEAVENTLLILSDCHNGNEIKAAIEHVYFKDPWKDLEKGDVQDRVSEIAADLSQSERQIYIWLQRARMAFGQERGLRIIM